jgi:hypothetical protein
VPRLCFLNLAGKNNRTIFIVMKNISYCMYKTLLISFLLPLQLFSAVYVDISNEKISWEGDFRKFNSAKGAFTTTGFKGAEYNAANNFLPVWRKPVEIPANTDISFSLSNEVYAPMSKSQIADTTQIDSTIAIHFKKGTIQKQAFAFVTLVPIRKNAATGMYERLVSFDLNTQIATDFTKNSHSSRGGSRSTTYAAASALARGNWYKVAVEKNGIYRISYSLLKDKFKTDPANIQLDKLSVWGTPGGLLSEVAGTGFVDDLTNIPCEVVDNNGNNRLDADDYILFYAQGPDFWSFDNNDHLYHHTKHLYSNKNFYFISTDKPRETLSSKPNGTASTTTITTFDDFDFRENDQYNLDESGRLWYGNRMSNTVTSATFNFSFPNLVKTEPQKVISKVAGSSTISYTSLAMNIGLSESGTNIATQQIYGTGNATYHNVAREARGIFSSSAASDNPVYSYSLTSYDPGGNAVAYIDFIEVNCKRQLQMAGEVMHFRSREAMGAGVTFRLSGIAPGLKVLDITNPTAPVVAGQANGSTYDIVTSDSAHEYVAYYTKNTLPEPEFAGAVSNQNLHAIQFPDMIIIRPADKFEAASNKLADFHRNEDGLSVEIVTLPHIYNEFSGGKQDVSAIRNFLKMLYDRAGNDTSLTPRYLCLMGDGSFDMRGITGETSNFIPTYQSFESLSPTSSFSSDDFYGLLDDGEGGGSILYGDNYLDIGVGRLPVTSDEEASGVVNKIVNYKSQAALGNWRNTLSFVADDEDTDIHFDASDKLAEHARGKYPVYNFDKIYLDAYQQMNTPAGPRFPDVNNAILNAIYKGTLLVNYVGHGGINNWSLERIFNMNDIQQLNNFNKLPLFVTATCEFSKFDKNGGQTAGEVLINNSKGGAIALITTVRLVYSNQNEALNSALFEHLFEPFNNRNPTLGELLVATKNNITLDENNRKFVLLGDPALKLNYPENNVVTTSVNGVPVNQQTDTLKALQQVTITGEVRGPGGAKMSSFNGVVYPTVYDKISSLTTLQNDASSPKRNFLLYKGILFNGKATVVNGEFSFSFLMPKDIDYKIGNGRISYYADDQNRIDAHGYESAVVIGGSIDTIPPDEQGPSVKLFMNDTTFKNKGITDANPILLAILEDDFGINVGNSLGHEITAVMDATSDKPIILNDFYESELNDFKKGRVKYPLYKLEEGPHTLSVKAWDTQNNSTEESIEFVVSSSSAIALQHLMNYPNPFSDNTTIAFEHNMAGKPVSIQVEIFTTAGDRVSSIQENMTPEGYRTLINWAGNTNEGGSVQQGLYVYRITLTDQDGNIQRATNKLVVIK